MTAIEEYLGASHEDIRNDVLARIRRYVEYETTSAHESAINILVRVIASELEAAGGRIEVMPAPGLGSNIVARFDGRDNSLAPILMLAHLDTVHEAGTLATRPFRIVGPRAEGPGVYDMKAGCALLVESVLWHVRKHGATRRPITMLLTCDEEIGSHSSRQLIDDHARRAEVVLVPEPCMPDGGIKTARKGVATYRIVTTGIASHAGNEPGTAVSAITELVRQSVRILELADHPKGTTVNIGVISGGTATNVVAASASMGVDVRLAQNGEGERIDNALRALKPTQVGATVGVDLAESRPPLVRTQAIENMYAKARACAADFGVDLPEGMSGGGSDGSFAAATGVPVLDGLGPRGGGAHAIDEHILIDDLPFRLALLCRLVERL